MGWGLQARFPYGRTAVISAVTDVTALRPSLLFIWKRQTWLLSQKYDKIILKYWNSIELFCGLRKDSLPAGTDFTHQDYNPLFVDT